MKMPAEQEEKKRKESATNNCDNSRQKDSRTALSDMCLNTGMNLNKKGCRILSIQQPVSKIGVTRFELATSRPPAERATKLRHTPKLFAHSFDIIVQFSVRVKIFNKSLILSIFRAII